MITKLNEIGSDLEFSREKFDEYNLFDLVSFENVYLNYFSSVIILQQKKA
jgi:hypothetical protein